MSEQAIKNVVIGRKNWLFSDTPEGADASMAVFSIVETAKANDLDPRKYLNYLLERRPSSDMTDEDFGEIAPWSKEASVLCGI